jgi:hypothetical protein
MPVIRLGLPGRAANDHSPRLIFHRRCFAQGMLPSTFRVTGGGRQTNMSQKDGLLEGRKLTWALWAVATLVTLSFAPAAYLVAHQVEHLLGGLESSTSMLTKASIYTAARLGTVAGGSGLTSAVVVFLLPRQGRTVIAFQVLAFLGVMAIAAYGMLAPFECMCDFQGGLVS